MTHRNAPLSEIVIEFCYRADGEDVSSLAEDIEARGLLQPILLGPELQLVVGHRRHAAFMRLGRTTIPAIVDASLDTPEKRLRSQIADENEHRTHTPEQKVAMTEDLLRLEKEEAAAREDRAASKDPDTGRFTTSGKFPEVDDEAEDEATESPEPEETGRALDKAAKEVGWSGKTLEKAREVTAAAHADSEQFGDLLEKMNRTGKVDGAYRELKARQKKAELATKKASAKVKKAVVIGDFREKMAALADDSVDLVFTDPPYDEDHLGLYAEVAEQAARVLKPGASLLAYAPHYAIGTVILGMEQYLRFWWLCGVHHKGASARLPGKWVLVEWKPIVWFVKNGRRDNEYVADMVTSEKVPDKDLHEWAQSLSDAKYYIERLTQPGELVVDPMCGSGTTLVAATESKRSVWGCDSDADRVAVARGRLMDATVQG